jgi:hypothetical protein
LATGTDSALDELESQRDFEWSRMVKVFGGDPAPTEGRKLSVFDVADRLGEVLSESEPPFGVWPKRAYDDHYRVTSFHYSHGHLGAVALYVDADSGEVRVDRESRAAHHLFAVAISLSIGLTHTISQELGVDAHDLGDIQEAAVPVYEETSGI